MEETLETTCFVSLHRNQVNPTLAPRSTLTFAHGDRMYGKSTFCTISFNLTSRKNIKTNAIIR